MNHDNCVRENSICVETFPNDVFFFYVNINMHKIWGSNGVLNYKNIHDIYTKPQDSKTLKFKSRLSRK